MHTADSDSPVGLWIQQLLTIVFAVTCKPGIHNQVMGNEEMTGIHTEKLGLSDSRALMETHQQPRNSACLLYTAEQGGVLFYIAKQRGRFIIYN